MVYRERHGGTSDKGHKVGSFPIGTGGGGARNLGEVGEGKGSVGAGGEVASAKSAMTAVSANTTAVMIEIIGIHREKALLLTALAARGMVREAHRREGRVAVPPHHLHPSTAPPHIST
jgi:hypothetical protein